MSTQTFEINRNVAAQSGRTLFGRNCKDPRWMIIFLQQSTAKSPHPGGLGGVGGGALILLVTVDFLGPELHWAEHG